MSDPQPKPSAAKSAAQTAAKTATKKAAGTAVKAVVTSKAGVTVGIVAVILVVVLTLIIGLPMLASSLTGSIGGSQHSAATDGECVSRGSGSSSGQEGEDGQITSGPAGKWTAEQQNMARTITDVTLEEGLSEYDAAIAVMVAMVESSLTNIEYGDLAGPDSRGLFQQRDHWGSLAQRMDPKTATKLFLHGNPSKNVPGLTSKGLRVHGSAVMVNDGDRGRLEPWITAQAVQRSAFMDGSNYQGRYSDAAQLVTAFTGVTIPDPWTPTTGSDGSGVGGGFVDPCSWGPSGNYPADGSGTVKLAPDGTYWLPMPGAVSGRLDQSSLCVFQGSAFILRCDAEHALEELAAAYTKKFNKPFLLVSAYRDYATQVRLKAEKGHFAAPPGMSNHGWGLAIDIHASTHGFEPSPQHAWLRENAPKYGWQWPTWARAGMGKYEPWHWEFVGTK